MSFRDMVASDIHNVFLNELEFAERHDITYDGVTYEGVLCVISQLKEQQRTTTMRDHSQGLYRVTGTLHCAKADIGNTIPEKGGKIQISDDEGFMRLFYVAQSGCDMGMVRLELEAIDE